MVISKLLMIADLVDEQSGCSIWAKRRRMVDIYLLKVAEVSTRTYSFGVGLPAPKRISRSNVSRMEGKLKVERMGKWNYENGIMVISEEVLLCGTRDDNAL